jgi:hypothetical protein
MMHYDIIKMKCKKHGMSYHAVFISDGIWSFDNKTMKCKDKFQKPLCNKCYDEIVGNT